MGLSEMLSKSVFTPQENIASDIVLFLICLSNFPNPGLISKLSEENRKHTIRFIRICLMQLKSFEESYRSPNAD